MSRQAENYYICMTNSTIKLTYVKSVPGKGSKIGTRKSENGKRASNISRARTEFLDLGQSNKWDYMGTLTSGTDGMAYEKVIRGSKEWLHNYNKNHGCKIKYLMVFELGEKGRRLHAHVLLRDVPESFLRPYTKQEYKKLPTDVKKLYSQYKTETGTRLCTCPAWKHGWSTIVPTDGSPKVVSYMTKYMTKGNIEFTTAFGGHAFFSSLGLKRVEKKKIPLLTAGTVWERIPENTWSHIFALNGEYDRYGRLLTGDVVSKCYILDKEKISPELWEYYSSLYEGLQDEEN